MTKNRTIPYGYIQNVGKMEIHTEESNIIKQIYLDYINGYSYNDIALKLTADKVKYIGDRTNWNKNIVARIIQNKKYLGTEEYPQIIAEEMQNRVISAKKPYKHTQDSNIKIIKPLLWCEKCGGKIERRVQKDTIRWKCENDISHIPKMLLDDDVTMAVKNMVIKKLKNFKLSETKSNKTSLEVITLQNKIDMALDKTEIDVVKVQEDIKKLAELKYELLEQTNHLKEAALKSLLSNPEENLGEIKYIIKRIFINQKEIVYFELIDGTKV